MGQPQSKVSRALGVLTTSLLYGRSALFAKLCRKRFGAKCLERRNGKTRFDWPLNNDIVTPAHQATITFNTTDNVGAHIKPEREMVEDSSITITICILKVLKKQTSVERLKQYLEEAFELSSKLVEFAKTTRSSYAKDEFDKSDFETLLQFEELEPNITNPNQYRQALEILYISIHGLSDGIRFVLSKEKSRRKITNDTLVQIKKLDQILSQLKSKLNDAMAEWQLSIPVKKVFDERTIQEITKEFLKTFNISENKLDSYRDFTLIHEVLLSSRTIYKELEILTKNI